MPIQSTRGVDQGDPIANAIFALAVIDQAEELRTKVRVIDPNVSVILVADDVQICTLPGALAVAASEARSLWAPAGLTFSAKKQHCWSLSAELLPAPFQAIRVERLKCLGNTLEDDQDMTAATPPQLGAESSCQDLTAAAQKVSMMAQAIDRSCEHGLQRQIGQCLFRYAAAGQSQHIIAARRLPDESVRAYDARLRAGWSTVYRISFY